MSILIAIELRIDTQALKWSPHSSQWSDLFVSYSMSCKRIAPMRHAPCVEILNLISPALLFMYSLWRDSCAIEHESLRTLFKDAIDTIVTNSRLDQERVGRINRCDETWDS